MKEAINKANNKGELRENVSHGTVSFPLATYYLEEKEFHFMKPHWHGEFEIIYLKKGSFRLKLNMKEFFLEGPALAFVEPGVIHSFQMENYPEENALVFDLKMLSFEHLDSIQYQIIDPILQGKLNFPSILSPKSNAWDPVLESYQQVLKASKQMNLAAKLRIKAYLYQMLASLYEHRCFQEVPEPKKDETYKLETMKQVLYEIHTNYGKRQTLGDLASMAGMSPQYFCRYFKKLTGKTVTSYLNEIRINKAADLLVKSEEKIIVIAGECGFENMGYFIKRFKRLKGSTPSEYRMAHDARLYQ